MTRAATRRFYSKKSSSVETFNTIEIIESEDEINESKDEIIAIIFSKVDNSKSLIDFSLNDFDETKTSEMIEKVYQEDEIIKIIIKAKRDHDRKMSSKILKKRMKLILENIEIRENRVYYKSRLFILEFNDLKLHFLRKHHDFSLQSHSEYRNMHSKLLKNYYWDKMKNDCRRYATNCFIYRRTKVYNISKQDLLTSLSISQRKWMNLSFDFVTKLSKCRRRNQIFENILVIVDRLIKRKLYESMMNIETQNLFNAFKRRVFCCYDLSISLINDRDEQITAKLWKRVCNRYDIKNKMFSSHRFETNDQIENANKSMKNYLRAYVKYV